MSYLLNLSSEILLEIASYLSVKTLLNLTETCKHLKEFLLENDWLWKRLCNEDFMVYLRVKGPFPSFYAIYQALYKYDIVQRHIYKEKCTLTLICDVFKLPDYLYHWCTLLNTCTNRWPLSRSILPRGKFMKMWGLTDNDLVKLPPHGTGRHFLIGCDHLGSHGFTWADGLEASVQKHGYIGTFHEVALQRCKKSQKRIEDKFPSAARITRMGKLIQFLNSDNNKKIEDLVMTRSHLMIFFDESDTFNIDSQCDHTIGLDYIQGLLHRTGFQQIVNFSVFCKDLNAKFKAAPHFTHQDLKLCSQYVYKELSHKATKQLISPEQFMRCANRYYERLHRVWEWQCKKGEEYQRVYRGQKLKSHPAYKNYIQGGGESKFKALGAYFDSIVKQNTQKRR